MTFEFLILLPPPLRCWGCQHAPPCMVYAKMWSSGQLGTITSVTLSLALSGWKSSFPHPPPSDRTAWHTCGGDGGMGLAPCYLQQPDTSFPFQLTLLKTPSKPLIQTLLLLESQSIQIPTWFMQGSLREVRHQMAPSSLLWWFPGKS